jgi:glycosyltransferase involved in cell wall biosynthesis
MKILLLCSHFPPVNRPGARRPYHLARHLCDAGEDVCVATGPLLGPDQWQADISGIKVHRSNFSSGSEGSNIIQRSLARAYHATRKRSVLERPMRLMADLFLPLNMDQRFEVDPEAIENSFGRPEVIIASGPAWAMFEIASRLAEKWRCTYLIDYRDPWSVRLPEVALRVMTDHGKGIIGKARKWRILRSELATTRNADGVTAATPTVLDNALAVIGKRPSRTILNGIEIERPTTTPDEHKLRILYSGQLYVEQEWSLFVRCIEELKRTRPDICNDVELLLVGVSTIHPSVLKILDDLRLRSGFIRTIPRMDRSSLKALQAKCALLLHVGFKEKKGILPLKFLEYVGSGIPVVQVSTGFDLQEDLLIRSRTGTIVREPAEFVALLTKAHAYWSQGRRIPMDPDLAVLGEHSWSAQMGHWHNFIREVHAHRESVK